MKVSINVLEEWNSRANFGNIEELANSLAANGQLSPIKLRKHPQLDGKFQLIYGNRRLAAAKRLGWSVIEADIVDVSDLDALKIAFAENEDRQNFSDYDKGMLFHKIHEQTGKSYSEIARILGKSKAYVSQHVALVHLFDTVDVPKLEREKVLVALTERHARILSRISNPKDRWDAAKLAFVAKLCVRELEKFVPRGMSKHTIKQRGRAANQIREMILEFIAALNRKDLRPYFEARSLDSFDMFDDFPPFSLLDNEKAKEHNFSVFKRSSELKMILDDLSIKTFGNSAVATMRISYELVFLQEKLKPTSRVSLFFLKKRRGWKIMHEHWSFANAWNLLESSDGHTRTEVLTRPTLQVA